VKKNTAGQKLTVFAFVAATNLPYTGDSANLAAYVRKDGGARAQLTDTSAEELDATVEKGYYTFDLTAEETNADTLFFSAKSTTAGVVVLCVPAVVYPTTENTLDLPEATGDVDSSPLIIAKASRGFTKDVVLLNAAGEAIVPITDDKVRAYIGREGELGTNLASAQFLVTSDSATVGGSSFTKNSPTSGKNRLRIDADDLDFEPGVYTLFIDFYDSTDTNEWKSASRDVFVLERT
jgi:hypothetical protein